MPVLRSQGASCGSFYLNDYKLIMTRPPALRVARISPNARYTVQGKAGTNPILSTRFYGIQMGNGDGLSPFFDGCLTACGLFSCGAQSILPQGKGSLDY